MNSENPAAQIGENLKASIKESNDGYMICVVALEEIAMGGCEGDGDWSGCREHLGDEQKDQWCNPCKADDAIKAAQKHFRLADAMLKERSK
jgi:hypothetical protein